MTLKLIKPEDRIVFLKKFTEELLINADREQRIKKKIEIEKLRQKFIEPLQAPEKAAEKLPSLEGFNPSTQFLEPKQQISYKEIEQRKPLVHRILMPPKKMIPSKRIAQLFRPTQKQMQEKIFPSMQQYQQNTPKTKEQILREIKPVAQPTPYGFNLGKIEQLLKDPLVQSIECQGPEKNILVKKNNRVNVTKITLSQKEISELINRFSAQARIPIVGGILKAAVGSLVISAIISEFVGSRFIINRITGYTKIRH